MLAIGCLIPFVLLAAGAALGSYLGDDRGGYWGAGAGFAAGLVVVGAMFWIMERISRRG